MWWDEGGYSSTIRDTMGEYDLTPPPFFFPFVLHRCSWVGFFMQYNTIVTFYFVEHWLSFNI